MSDDERGGTNPLWDPFGLWRDVNRLVNEQGFSTVGAAGPQAPLQMLLDLVRSRLVGREVGWTVAGVPLKFELDDLDLSADPVLLAMGQAERVIVSASQMTWGEHEIVSARATIHNVHTRSGLRPKLVGAPIDVSLRLTSQYVSERVRMRVPWLRLEITAIGEVQARLTNRRDWGWVNVSLEVAGDRILVTPRVLTRGRRGLRLPARTPGFPLGLNLPPDMRLTGLEVIPGAVELRLRVDERHLEYREALSYLSGARTG